MLENLTTLPAYNRPTLLTKQKLCTSNCLSSLSGSTALPAKNMISPKQEHDFTEASELVMKIANNDARKQTWQQSKLPLMMLIASPDSCTGKPEDQSYRTIAIMSIMTKWVTYQKLIVQRWTYMLATVLKIAIQKLLHVKFLNIVATRSDSDSKALVRGSDASSVCGSWRTPFFEMARIAWCRAKRCNSHDILRTWLHRWKSESSPHWCRWKKWNHVCLQYRTICNQMFQGWT